MRDLVRLASAGFCHSGSSRPVLRDIDLSVREGDRVLIRGPSGCGKSTLLQMLAGLAPEYVPGVMTGTAEYSYAAKGIVLQNPEAQIITPSVEEEVAFALENARMPGDAIRRRVDEVLERLGIARLAGRHPLTLSGGECQRVSLAAAIARQPDILFLDEPTAYLDGGSSQAFFDALGLLPERTAVVVVEHRIREAAAVCSASYELTVDGGVVPSDFREAPLLAESRKARPRAEAPSPSPALEVRGMSHGFGASGPPLFAGVSLAVRPGEIAALTGPSGCGKTTILGKIARILPPGSDTVRILGKDAAALRERELNGSLLYVPQNPEHMFVAETVRAELGLSGPQAVESALRFGLGERLSSNPYKLSEGEKRRLNLSVAVAEHRPLYLLDEPTYGLDDASRSALAEDLAALAETGAAVLFVSHDEDFVRGTADTVFRMQEGAIVREEVGRAGAPKSA